MVLALPTLTIYSCPSVRLSNRPSVCYACSQHFSTAGMSHALAVALDLPISLPLPTQIRSNYRLHHRHLHAVT